MQCCKSVKIRQRKKKNGTISLFLEFYPGYRNPETMELIRRKILGIYLYAEPKNSRENEFNKMMLDKAEAIRCQIYAQVIDERYGFFQPSKLKESFLEYFEELCHKDRTKRLSSFKHFQDFVDNHCTFGDLDLQLCNKFREYLLGNLRLKNGKKAHISQNSASAYFNVFRYVVKKAFLAEKIRDNLAERLEGISCTPTVRNHLTLEELRQVYNTDCVFPVMKKAIVFSCLSGLRLSDIINLKWDNFRTYADGGRYIDFICAKTDRQTTVPISEEAYEVVQPQEGEFVFEGFNRDMINNYMKIWLKEEVGITKHITFHCFRHTYATLQIELGTDIYTVQHLLAHRNVTTTQIYVAQATTQMREAASKITLKDVKKVSKKRLAKIAEEEKISKTSANLLKEMRSIRGSKR